jgi:hypothetical protein
MKAHCPLSVHVHVLGQKSFETNQKFQGDKAYVGEPSINIPTKKPRSSPDRVLYPEDFAKKGELTPSQKEQNKELASERIFVEHLIRVIKIFRIASERFRLNTSKYEQIIMTICGLVRLRIGSLVL